MSDGTTGAKKRSRSSVEEESDGPANKKMATNAQHTSSTSRDETAAGTSLPTPPKSEETLDTSSNDEKPPLTIEDLYFDYDRSQLRDPRATPGRKARPHYGEHDIPVELRERLERTRNIFEYGQALDSTSSTVATDMFLAEARNIPWKGNYNMYQCYDKGRDGSPTYDACGFQLDYGKVAKYFEPSKHDAEKRIRYMPKDEEVRKGQREGIYKRFFRERPNEYERTYLFLEEIVRDQMSKDLDVPSHQLSIKHAKLWRKKGFQPVRFRQWWREPNEEEKRRLRKMQIGSALRKHV
jgi:hypothetical protein